MHKAETVLAAFTTAVTGLATTGANVQRGRAYAVPALPGLSISMGDDQVDPDLILLNAYQRLLEVFVDIHVQATGNLETTLNQVRAEIYAAIAADRQLGGSCLEVDSVIDERPEISGDQDQPIARQRMQFRAIYRHSSASAEA